MTIFISCLEQIFLFIFSFPQQIPDLQINFIASPNILKRLLGFLSLNCSIQCGKLQDKGWQKKEWNTSKMLHLNKCTHVFGKYLFHAVVLFRDNPETSWEKRVQGIFASLPLASELNAVATALWWGARSICFPPRSLRHFWRLWRNDDIVLMLEPLKSKLQRPSLTNWWWGSRSMCFNCGLEQCRHGNRSSP